MENYQQLSIDESKSIPDGPRKSGGVTAPEAWEQQRNLQRLEQRPARGKPVHSGGATAPEKIEAEDSAQRREHIPHPSPATRGGNVTAAEEGVQSRDDEVPTVEQAVPRAIPAQNGGESEPDNSTA